MSGNLLDSFLSVAANEFEDLVSHKQLKDIDLFSKKDDDDEKAKTNKPNKLTAIHRGDTDSSDDEDNKYYEERKYNESGRDLKHLLGSSPTTSKNYVPQSEITWKSKPSVQTLGLKEKTLIKAQGVHTDPIFGLRIINPLVSFTTFQDRMVGREAVSFSRIKKFVIGNISDKNWVIAGVIVGRSSVRTSQKGKQFLIWSLSDLKNDIKTVSVFLFGSAYKQLWKTATGTVVGILNSSILEKKDGSKDEATLSVDNAQKVMILGQSKDLGTCKSTKKNGEPCTAIVNVNNCEYCIYHIKQEYQKCSKRSELQSNFSGKGLTALRNKVLGKDEVFYAGRIYTAIPAKRSRKLEQKDQGRLQALSKAGINTHELVKTKKVRKTPAKAAANIEVTHRQRLRDLTLLEKLGGGEVKSTFNALHSAEVTLESSQKMANDVIAKLKTGISSNKVGPESNLGETVWKSIDNSQSHKVAVKSVPFLSGNQNGTIDLGIGVSSKQINRAKLNAFNYIQRNGPLLKSNPNSTKKSGTESRKRVIENVDNSDNPSKKQKTIENEFLSDRFKKIMEATSKHTDLLDDRDNEEQEKYFHKLEKKEEMEEKMINTYKVPCKAVRCLKCKYTNFSASQFCKDNKHPLKVFDAMKRFFKCGNCGNRTQSLEIIPTTLCSSCGSGKWERTGMMKEKKAEVTHSLSIRGGEQKFVNSVAANANLDLLVPDE